MHPCLTKAMILKEDKIQGEEDSPRVGKISPTRILKKADNLEINDLNLQSRK